VSARRRAAWTGAIAVLLAVLLLWGWSNRDSFAPADVGTRAPDFAAVTLDGRPAGLADWRGQVVLLNIWATWCPPCIEEMPSLQRLHDSLAGEDFSVVAVSIDALPGSMSALGQPGGDVSEFVAHFGLTFPVLHDPSGEIQRRYGAPGLPATFIIDREGRIRHKILGARDWEQPQHARAIRALLDG
jgi:cytochrome c biogenesis protein CcmG, thiol:disulfide interchange protein DsbE